MNILWVTNTIFPDPSKALGLPVPVVGGWMYALADQVEAQPGIHLAVATTYSDQETQMLDIEGICYYMLPTKSKTTYQTSLESVWRNICSEFKPDVVHIHGTEYPQGLACMRSCPSQKYVISMQGMISVIAKNYYAGMTPCDILNNITFRDIMRWDTLIQGKKGFEKRGEFEKEYLKRADHVIGRTSWDYAHTKSINPSVSYHFCNESLRNSFYTADKWDVDRKTEHTIFCSQAGYPIKGLHQVLKAVALLKKDFPDIQIRVAGHSIINQKSLRDRLKLSGYGKYLRKLIKREELEGNVDFTGPLSEQQMIKEYKNAHVFICPSSIENSPNSLAEAQMLGVPAVASYVGGIPDMVTHGQTGLLYRFEEIEMLAENIRRIFLDDKLAMRLSSNGIAVAQNRHDRRVNLEQLLEIYDKVRASR